MDSDKKIPYRKQQLENLGQGIPFIEPGPEDPEFTAREFEQRAKWGSNNSEYSGLDEAEMIKWMEEEYFSKYIDLQQN